MMRPFFASRFMRTFLTSGFVLLICGCSTIDRGSPPALETGATWAVIPFANHTETPLAGSRAESIAESLLQTSGVGRVKHYSGLSHQDTLFNSGDEKRQQEVLAWAREQKIRYALTGAVDEWRYKVGVDGEPAAGITLRIVDVSTGDTLWTASGGKSGWSREALSALGQKLIRQLLSSGLSGAR